MKKKMSIIMLIVFIIILGTVLYIFIGDNDNDDFAPYISKEYDEVYDIQSDIYNLTEIKSELTEIAQKYEEGLKLTFAQYDIEENSKKSRISVL